jgi:hypothetical protein
VEVLWKRKFAGDTGGLMQELTHCKIQVLVNAVTGQLDFPQKCANRVQLRPQVSHIQQDERE